MTVFGALVEMGKKGQPHRFRRERRNLPVMRLDPGPQIIWDGRYRFTNEGAIHLMSALLNGRNSSIL